MLKRAHFIQDTSQGPDITRVRPDRITVEKRATKKSRQIGKKWDKWVNFGVAHVDYSHMYMQTYRLYTNSILNPLK